MGQVKLLLLCNYWNTYGELTPTPVETPVFTKNRFDAILTNLHLADNTSNDGSNRLYKISSNSLF